MSTVGKRGIAAAMTVVIAAAVNIATGMLTQHWAARWWATTTALVVIGVGAQVWLTVTDAAKPGDNEATGDRAVRVGRDNTGIVSTGDRATNIQQTAEASGDGRVYQAGRDQRINDPKA
jgi:hypothetical protein